MPLGCALLARKDWAQLIPSRSGSVSLEFMDGNVIVSIWMKCCLADRSKQHFCAFSAIAETLNHGGHSAS
jgi:hypothetical protein